MSISFPALLFTAAGLISVIGLIIALKTAVKVGLLSIRSSGQGDDFSFEVFRKQLFYSALWLILIWISFAIKHTLINSVPTGIWQTEIVAIALVSAAFILLSGIVFRTRSKATAGEQILLTSWSLVLLRVLFTTLLVGCGTLVLIWIAGILQDQSVTLTKILNAIAASPRKAVGLMLICIAIATSIAGLVKNDWLRQFVHPLPATTHSTSKQTKTLTPNEKLSLPEEPSIDALSSEEELFQHIKERSHETNS